MASNMTSTKIDVESREKLTLLAKRGSRSAPSMLKLIIEQAWRSNPAELSENALLSGMMEQIVDDIEAGVTSPAASADMQSAKAAGVISWGSENGVVIGTMGDGTRLDLEGNLLNN